MKAFTVICVLEGGRRTELQVLARTSCDALDSAIATFGELLRICSVRPRLTVHGAGHRETTQRI